MYKVILISEQNKNFKIGSCQRKVNKNASPVWKSSIAPK